MSDNERQIETLRAELHSLRARKEQVSTALLDPDKDKEEVKRLFDEGADLDQKIADLEARIRILEFPPDTLPGAEANFWNSQ